MRRNRTQTCLKAPTKSSLALIMFVCLLISAVAAGASSDVERLPEPGETILFGHYEQDNNPDNGKEPISWIVLAVEGDRALLISEKNLDCKPYHNEQVDTITWETSSLRAWLNNEFLSTAFAPEEQKAVLSTTVKNDDNAYYEIQGGNDTDDRVFLLSFGEARRLFADDAGRRALNTPYAKAQRAYTDDFGRGHWWLRSPGGGTNYAAYVDANGSVLTGGYFVDSTRYAVRPALWMDLRAIPDAAGQASLPAQGSVIPFGRYEQDNDPRNGKEPISWVVLEMKGDRMLVISEKNLDCKPYNIHREPVTWESSTLRAWLNNEFLNTAFTSEEQNAILTTTVKNEDNPVYGTKGGADTSDKVFLLDIAQAEQLFNNNGERIAWNTAYAEAQGEKVQEDGSCWWWLRSPGDAENIVAHVDFAGGVVTNGNWVDFNLFAVRPALYIDLDSGGF